MTNQARTAVRNGTTVCRPGRSGWGGRAFGAGLGAHGVEEPLAERLAGERVEVGTHDHGGQELAVGRFAVEQQAAAGELVEAVEDRAGDGGGVLIAAGHRQSS